MADMHGSTGRSGWWVRRSSCAMAALGLLVSACGATGTAGEDSPAYQPVASVDEVMDAIVIPASDAVFDAVVYANGVLERAPETDADWAQLRLQAMALAEAGNLLMLPGRAVDSGDWLARSNQMIDEALEMAAAADARDTALVLETGSALYRSCVACHEQYIAG